MTIDSGLGPQHPASLLAEMRPAARAMLARIEALLPGLQLELLSIDGQTAVALASPLGHELAVVEWEDSSRRWIASLRLCGTDAGSTRIRSLAIVPRDDLNAARAAHDGNADAVVWHDDDTGIDQALSRLLRFCARAAPGDES